ncbi:MAG: Bax inhibitor-1/YccA family protein [Alphaproteobacteria bacterium]|nr:Bax inhibitor-1/YccA family protein [Alphaproteobacteria bacterium]
MAGRKTFNTSIGTEGARASAKAGGLSAYVRRVFNYMAISLGITASISFFMINTGFVFHLITNQGLTGLGTLFLWAPVLLVFGMAFIKSMQGSKLMLYTVAAIQGVSISILVLAFGGIANAFQAFLLTGIIFGSMAMYGYITKADLSKMGSVLIMGVWGLFLVGIVGAFTGGVGMWFSYAVVGVFTLLVAYEMQMVKAIYYSFGDRTTLDKMAVMAALNLYLSFINIFIHLMRIMGSRD